MHTEHLNNVRVSYVFTGWLVSVAVACLLVFILIATGQVDAEANTGGNWIAGAMALGFLAGGAMVGYMVALAPILHGILIALTSLVVWAVVNAVVAAFFPSFHWTTLSGDLAVVVMLVQVASAVVGARLGHRFAEQPASLQSHS